MEELKKLVEIVTERGRKNLPILDVKSDDLDRNKELKLFRVIQKLERATDQEAAREMYNSGVEDPRYKMLKHRLKSKLLNHLFFIDFKDHSPSISYQFEQETLNYLYFSQVLLKNGEWDLAEKTINKGLSLANEGEFTIIIISYLELLREVYSLKCQSNNFQNNLKLLKRYRKIHQSESEALDMFSDITLKLRKSVNSRRKSLGKAIRTVDKLKKLLAKSPSYEIFEKHHLLNLSCLELTGKYEEVIRITQKMDKEYQNSSLNVLRFDPRANKLRQLRAYLRAGYTDQGLNECQSLSTFFDKTNPDYFYYLEEYFLLAVQNKDYKLATDLLKTAIRGGRFLRLDNFSKDRWELYKAYMYLIKPEKRLLKSLDFSLYFEQIPAYHKDRKGLNIAILVVQYLYNLQQGKRQFLSDIIVALENYASLHLYHLVSQRSRIFLKLLLIAWENQFDPEKCRMKSQVSIRKLENLHPAEDLSIEIEAIPYQHLWELLTQEIAKTGKI